MDSRAKPESSVTPEVTSKKRGSKTSYEEYKKQVLTQSRLQARRRSEMNAIELFRQKEAEKDSQEHPDMSWLVKGKSEKKQHYEKTVGEIDQILSELKHKGIAEPESPTIPHPSNGEPSDDVSIAFLEGQSTSRKSNYESNEVRTHRGEVDREQRKLDEEYRHLSLDDPQKRWGEAHKTRYVRSKDPRDVDIILSTEQIFDTEDSDSSQKGWWKNFTQQCPQKQQTSPTNKHLKKRNSIY